MFSVVMFILKLLRRRFYIRIDQLAAGSHLGNFFQDNCVVNSLMCIFSPGKRSVVFAEDCRNCFVIFIFEIVGNEKIEAVESRFEFSDYVKNDLAPALESLEGVASVTTTGQLEESVDVTLDQDKIDALNKKIQKKIDEQFEKSQKKIDAGKKKVESGKSSISQGSEQLNSAINQTMDQQKKLYKTEQDLKKQLAELKKQKASLEQIQTGIQTFMKSDAWAISAASLTSSSDASGAPNLILDAIVPENRIPFCGTKPIFCLTLSMVRSLISCPSIVIDPSVTS